MKISVRMFFAGTVVILSLASCEDDATQTTKRWADKSLPANMPVPLPWYTEEQVAAGERLYRSNCAECHGKNAAGEEGWQARGSDGMRRPPPLNGTGHSWHHSVNDLRELFMVGNHGTEGKTPTWVDKLTNEDALAITAWLQSRWPNEVYAKWHYMHHRDHGH